MLTREHAIADYRGGRIIPDRLLSKKHAQYHGFAQRLLEVYENGIGLTRRELHNRIKEVFSGEEDCPTRRIEAFCKLLDDASTFPNDRSGKAARLRKKVFRLAAEHHPLVETPNRLFESAEKEIKDRIAADLKRDWADIEENLYADVKEFHRLAAFEGYPDARALLSRYNVAQVQAALYLAVKMTITARQDFKTILRHAKLARLLHRITRLGQDEYRIELDGPASLFRKTRLYGVNMARFLPKLLACQGWKMEAVIRTPRKGKQVLLKLCPKDGLQTYLDPPEDFDSSVEEAFARKWGDQIREGWSLIREGGIMHCGQKVFIPDFVFRHEDGREIPMEVIGFWTTEYLREKVETLRLFRDQPIILAVGQVGSKRITGLPEGTIFFKLALKLNSVLERLKEVPS